jgi:hypothetical protein
MSAKTNIATKTNRVAFAYADDTFTWTFPNGRAVRFDPTKCNEEIAARATLNGFKQKIADAMAMERNKTTGASASADDKASAMEEVIGRLYAGNWRVESGERESTGGLLAAALAIVTKKPLADVVAKLKTLDKTQKAALTAQPKIAAAIAKLRAEKVKASGMDVDALLEDF